MTTDNFLLSHWNTTSLSWAERGAVAKMKWQEWQMKHLISYSWLFCWLFMQLEQNQKAHTCHALLLSMDPACPVKGAQLIHTILYVPSPWCHYGNKQEKCSQMNAEGWKSQRMPNVSITKSATVRASKGVLAAVHISLDREGIAEFQAYLWKKKWSVSIPQSLRVGRRMLSPRWQRIDNQVYKKQA